MKAGLWYHIKTIYGESALVHIRKVTSKHITFFYHYNGKPKVCRMAKNDIISFYVVTGK